MLKGGVLDLVGGVEAGQGEEREEGGVLIQEAAQMQGEHVHLLTTHTHHTTRLKLLAQVGLTARPCFETCCCAGSSSSSSSVGSRPSSSNDWTDNNTATG